MAAATVTVCPACGWRGEELQVDEQGAGRCPSCEMVLVPGLPPGQKPVPAAPEDLFLQSRGSLLTIRWQWNPGPGGWALPIFTLLATSLVVAPMVWSAVAHGLPATSSLIALGLILVLPGAFIVLSFATVFARTELVVDRSARTISVTNLPRWMSAASFVAPTAGATFEVRVWYRRRRTFRDLMMVSPDGTSRPIGKGLNRAQSDFLVRELTAAIAD